MCQIVPIVLEALLMCPISYIKDMLTELSFVLPIKERKPNLVVYLNKTPILEWWVVRCMLENGH